MPIKQPPLQRNEPLSGSRIFFHTPTPQARNMFLYPLCLGHFICDANYYVARKSYDSFLFMYIKKGICHVSASGHSYQAAAGQLILLDCYQAHTYGAASDLEFYWIHFDGLSARSYYELFLPLLNQPLSANRTHAKGIERIFSFLLSGFEGQYLLKEIHLNKYITDLLTLLSQSPEDAPLIDTLQNPPDSASYACEQAKDFMRQHFMEPLSIADVAAHAGLSSYYLIRRFKELFGITPHQYLLGIRLDSACFYLRTSERSIKDIAFTCGFQSENHFCIAFKKQAGMTPTCYRNLI